MRTEEEDGVRGTLRGQAAPASAPPAAPASVVTPASPSAPSGAGASPTLASGRLAPGSLAPELASPISPSGGASGVLSSTPPASVSPASASLSSPALGKGDAGLSSSLRASGQAVRTANARASQEAMGKGGRLDMVGATLSSRETHVYSGRHGRARAWRRLGRAGDVFVSERASATCRPVTAFCLAKKTLRCRNERGGGGRRTSTLRERPSGAARTSFATRIPTDTHDGR